jgi:cell division protein FtsL
VRPSAAGSGSPDAHAFSAVGAASAVGGAAAGLAGSVASAFQGRNAGGKRRGQASVRRSPKRQAQLTLSRVEPWSVMKFSFVVSVVAFIILFVAVFVLYMVLSALGVFTSLEHTVSSVTSSQGSAGTNISNWFSASRILGYTGMLGALNIVLITAMSTIGAVIYNLIATTIGGVEVTLRETD